MAVLTVCTMFSVFAAFLIASVKLVIFNETPAAVVNDLPAMKPAFAALLHPELGITWKLVRLLFYPSMGAIIASAAMIAGLTVSGARKLGFYRRQQTALTPASTPFMMFTAICFIFLIINFLFTVAVIGSIDPVGGEGLLFKGILVLTLLIFGIGIIFIVTFFSGLFNPAPVLFLSENEIQLGEKNTLSWKFTGKTAAVRRFKIVLEGTESTEIGYTDHRGRKKRKIFENKFARFLVLDTSDSSEVMSGRLEFATPPDTMHSFKSLYNRIEWCFRVYGEIEHRPDIDEFYPINVTPALNRQKGF